MTVHHEKPPTIDDASIKGVLGDIDQFFDDLSSLAELATERTAFYDDLLSRTVKISDSSRGTMLTIGPGEELLVLREFPLIQGTRRVARDECQRASAAVGSSRSVIVQAEGKNGKSLIAVPVQVLGKTSGVLAYYRPANESPEVTRAYLPLLDAVAEIASEFEKNQILREGQRHDQQFEAISRLSLNAHRHLNSKQVAVHLVNDTRVYVNCDRVGLFVMPPHRVKLLACSGVAVTDTRSSYIKTLRPVIRQTIKTGKPIVIHPAAESHSPQLEHYLATFPDEQRPRHVAIVPLRDHSTRSDERPGKPFGALVIESFSPQDEVRFFQGIDEVTKHASSAMSNALSYEQIPLRWIWRGLQLLGAQFGLRHLIRTIAWIAVIAAISLFLVFAKTDFRVEARGELKPSDEQQVFAPADAVVEKILVRHGDIVERDEVVIRLRSPEMELDLRQLDGDLETARQRLDGLLTVMKAADAGDPEGVVMQSRLAADISETRSVIAGLVTRQEFMQNQIEQLKVKSPISGYVITWNVEQLLQGRPVRRGESLLKIADVSGEWLMVLDISDRKYGYVVQAQESGNRSDLPVTVVLASDPGKKYESRLDEYSVASAVRESQETSVRVSAPIASDQLSRFKPGTSVIGRINCGRHNVVYVWTADLVDAVRRRFF